jgi:hypothetical protein
MLINNFTENNTFLRFLQEKYLDFESAEELDFLVLSIEDKLLAKVDGLNISREEVSILYSGLSSKDLIAKLYSEDSHLLIFLIINNIDYAEPDSFCGYNWIDEGMVEDQGEECYSHGDTSIYIFRTKNLLAIYEQNIEYSGVSLYSLAEPDLLNMLAESNLSYSSDKITFDIIQNYFESLYKQF